MTTELEQEFFNVFGIEPKKIPTQPGWCPDVINDYPDITAEKLLKMICIANKANIEVIGETVEETKNKLLEEMIYWKDDIIYKQIQQLFKEDRQE